jgi:ATP-binding cassette subfamily F protein 3
VDTSHTIYEELLSVKADLLRLEEKIRECENDMKHADGDALEDLMKQYTSLTHAFETGGGYLYRSELVGVLKGLGFTEDEFSKPVATLSGGQKTRVALGRLLLQNPDLIILDEPTNHLDMNSIAWLETYLLNYKGAVLIVSHDRYFLDRIAGKVIEIDQSKATTFMGNYSDYAVKKEQLRVAAWNAYMNQQREIKHQEEVIEKLKSFNREKSIKRAESREKMLDKIEVIEKPSEVRTDMKLTLTPRILSGNDVLTVEHLSKSFDSHKLFTDVNFEIKRGEHVAIIGDNGSGKTTLLKILNGLVPADQGTFRLGSNVEIGYYDQEHHVLHSEKTLFEEISDDYPYLNNTQIRNVLAAFLFTGEDVFKRISDLSGGERGRVSLAKLVLSNANFLILDEPTNHLDIMSKEILEDALNGYEGTILYVSHDRYFINRTAHRILDLTEGQFVSYVGNYDYYLEKHDTVMAAIEASTPQSADADNTAATKAAESEVKLDWKAQKEEQARQRKRQNDLKKVEDEIHRLETRDGEIDGLLCDESVFSDVAKLMELNREKEDIAGKLETLYEKWEELAE